MEYLKYKGVCKTGIVTMFIWATFNLWFAGALNPHESHANQIPQEMPRLPGFTQEEVDAIRRGESPSTLLLATNFTTKNRKE